MSLTPFTGTWTRNEAAHLLRRTMFGPTHAQISAVAGMTMTYATVLSLGYLKEVALRAKQQQTTTKEKQTMQYTLS